MPSPNMIERSLLMARSDLSRETGAGFYLVWPRGSPLIPKAEKVRDWILSEANTPRDT